jgi:hypothetical protein
LGETGLQTRIVAIVSLCGIALSACGGDVEAQDEDNPSGEFPVEVVKSKFPTRQRLAQRQELVLGVRNAGDETIPNLAFTIFLNEGAGAPFSVRLDQPGLANPDRPVWVLANGFPKLAGESETAGATSSQTNTFQFGPLEPDQTLEAVWRLIPVKGGTYTLNYKVNADLFSKAKAVTADGSAPTGKLVVTISTKPPKTRVDDQGNVVTAP